jgi:hypothetical protein
MNTYDLESGLWMTEGDRYDAFVAGNPEYREANDLMRILDDPEWVWPRLLAMVEEIDDDLLGQLGAGPLEELVVHHAAAFIDRIEARSRADAKFRECLSCIWLTDGRLSPAIQQRLVDVTEGGILILPPDLEAK